jgi:hypothetical protein
VSTIPLARWEKPPPRRPTHLSELGVNCELEFAAKPGYAVSQAATTSSIEQVSVAIAINSNLPMTIAKSRRYTDVSSSRQRFQPLTLGVSHVNASVVAID